MSEWAIYIYQYKSVLDQLLTMIQDFTQRETEAVTGLVNDISVLLILIKTDMEVSALTEECESLKKVNEQNNNYQSLLDCIVSVDVCLEEADTGNWLSEEFVTDDFTLMMVGDVVSMKSSAADKVLELYSKLSTRPDTKAVLVMNEAGARVEKTDLIHHIIEGESTLWAYVFYKMFGTHAIYTKERNAMVEEMIQTSQRLGISVDFLVCSTRALCRRPPSGAADENTV